MIRSLLTACALGTLSGGAFGQPFASSDSLEIRADITEFEALRITKLSDMDFGSIRYLVTHSSQIGYFGWGEVPVAYDGVQISCERIFPNALDGTAEADRIIDGSPAALRVDGEANAHFTYSFEGIADLGSNNPWLPLFRVGGTESIRLTRMEYHQAQIRSDNTLSPSFRSITITNTSDRLSDAGNFSFCFYGAVELENDLPAGTYTNSFTVTVSYP